VFRRTPARCAAGTLVFLGVLGLLPGIAGAEDTDVVTVLNGDSLTGEIKSYQRGTLRFKTDATDTIQIEWDEVARLVSEARFQVEHESGRRYVGSLVPATEARHLRVSMIVGEIELNLGEIVRIHPVEDSWLKRLDGGISAGYSFTKSSDVTQFTFAGDVVGRTLKTKKELGFSSILTDQEDGTTQRDELRGAIERFLKRRFFARTSLSFQRNEELGIDLRSLIEGSGGRYLVQTTHSELALSGGFAFNQEVFIADEPNEENVEFLVGLSYDLFRDSPRDVSVSVGGQYYISLTQPGRTRSEIDAQVRYELIKDLTWDLTFYSSHDSDPPEDAESSDYGVVASLGWSF
jgi:hypothetical protein